MTLENAEVKFIEILRELEGSDKYKFLKWIHTNWDLDCLTDCHDASSKKILESIAIELRSKVPLNAVLPSEKINLPICGPNSDCHSSSTIHVDEFLYDDEYINDLVEKGLMSRHFCGDCFSQNIKLYTFISHSMSVSRIEYLFRCLLPPLKNEIVLDVGSRLGAVLYGAYVFTSSQKIIGVEINSDFCKIQNEIIKKYKFSGRIEIICNNIFNEIDILSSADVVILNNVFEFFTDTDSAITSWHLLAQHLKLGCTIITVPHLSDTFQHIKVNFNWKYWVEELTPFQPQFSVCDEDMESHRQNVKHYKVKKVLNKNEIKTTINNK